MEIVAETVDVESARRNFEKQDWVVVPGAVSTEFFEYVCAFARPFLTSSADGMGEWAFAKKKEQFLFEFDAPETMDALRNAVARLVGTKPNQLTLCERHIKSYDPEADPCPMPHKDRLASEFVVGIPIVLADDTYLVAYPHARRDVNPFQSSAEFRAYFEDEAQFENLSATEPVRLYAKPGDLIIFRGSSMFHERMNAAGSALLYFKLNSLRLDPIGEDPRTVQIESESNELFEVGFQEEFQNLYYELSPRLEKVQTYFSRDSWREIRLANLWGRPQFRISDQEFALIRNLKMKQQGAELFSDASTADSSDGYRLLRRLIEKGAICVTRQ